MATRTAQPATTVGLNKSANGHLNEQTKPIGQHSGLHETNLQPAPLNNSSIPQSCGDFR